MLYYMVQVDFEYITGNDGEYDPRKTKAARLRKEDTWLMRKILEYCDVTSVTMVPTTYKPVGTTFLDPIEWLENRTQEILSELLQYEDDEEFFGQDWEDAVLAGLP